MKDLISTRKILLYVFLISLIGQILIFFIQAISDTIPFSSLTDLTTNILKIYSSHLAVIISSFIFSTKKKVYVPSTIFYVSLTLAIFWNALLVIRTVAFFIDITFSDNSRDKIDYVMSFQKEVSEISSFIVIGLMAYFFQSKEEK
jgi:hypothetical protein